MIFRRGTARIYDATDRKIYSTSILRVDLYFLITLFLLIPAYIFSSWGDSPAVVIVDAQNIGYYFCLLTLGYVVSQLFSYGFKKHFIGDFFYCYSGLTAVVIMYVGSYILNLPLVIPFIILAMVYLSNAVWIYSMGPYAGFENRLSIPDDIRLIRPSRYFRSWLRRFIPKGAFDRSIEPALKDYDEYPGLGNLVVIIKLMNSWVGFWIKVVGVLVCLIGLFGWLYALVVWTGVIE